MKHSVFITGVIILAGATLLGGVIQGRMSRRWSRSQEFQTLADRLRELPTEIGTWKMREPLPLDPTAEAVLECAGYVIRKYENQKTGEIVTVALLLGPSGPISVHTPDVCYSGQEYTVIGSPEKTQFDVCKGSLDELWNTSLKSTNLTAGDLRVYYGWSTGGPWSAPENARLTFAGQPYLYKVQVVGPLPSPIDEKTSDHSLIFLKALLPVLRQYLIEHVKE